MTWDQLPYFIPYLLALLVTIGIGVYAWRRRDVPGAAVFAGYILAESSWTLGYIFELASDSQKAKVFWDDTQFFGFAAIPAMILIFALQFVGDARGYSRRLWSALGIFTLLSPGLAFTDSYHHLIRANTAMQAGDPFSALTYDFTPTFWAITIYAYGLTLYASYLLILHFISQPVFRAQAGLIITGFLFPLTGGILTLAGITLTHQRDTTPLTFAIGNLFVLWGLFRFHLFDLTPIAHHVVLETMSDAVIVLDGEDRVIELNPAAQRLLNIDKSSTIGQPARGVFAAWPDMIEHFSDVDQFDDEITVVNEQGDTLHFELRIAPLHSRRSAATGRLIMLHDITARKQAEHELAQHRDNLEQILIERTAEVYAAHISLQKSETRYRSLVNNAPIPIVIYQDGRCVYVNAAALALHGAQQASDLLGKPLIDFIHPDDRTAFFQRARAAGGNPHDIHQAELRIVRLDGQIVDLEATAMAVEFEDELAYMVIATDVTERNRTQTALREYATRLETLREIDQAILLAETPGTIAEAALTRLHHLVPYERASITLFHPDRGVIELLAAFAAGTTQLTTGASIPESEWMGREQLSEGQTHYVKDILALDQIGRTEQILIDEGIRSYVNVPLIVQEMLIGSLNIGASHTNAFTPNTLEIAREIANQVAIAIQQTRLRTQIQRHAEELELRVDARTAELTVANQRLQELSRVKDEFVSNVSHELRTPLTNFRLYLQLLERRPENYDRYIDTLSNETERLTSMIDSLLMLSRLDQDRTPFHRAPVDLNALTDAFVSDRIMLAQQRGITLSLTPAPEMPPIEADYNLLSQALGILLTNAIHYTPAGGSVTVGTFTQTRAERLCAGFSVQDTGPGIPPDEQPQLFSRFFRGTAGLESGVSGTGLGLAIARTIIDRHHGGIDVQSPGIPGQGATFTVWLPVATTEEHV